MLLLLHSSIAENTCLDWELEDDKVKGLCYILSNLTKDFGLNWVAQAGMSHGTWDPVSLLPGFQLLLNDTTASRWSHVVFLWFYSFCRGQASFWFSSSGIWSCSCKGTTAAFHYLHYFITAITQGLIFALFVPWLTRASLVCFINSL